MNAADTYNIKQYSKWKHKDGSIYIVLEVKQVVVGNRKFPIVIYYSKNSEYTEETGAFEYFARDLKQFKKNFKEIEWKS